MSATITMSLVNPAIPGGPPPTIYSGTAASLNVSLGNLTGSDINLTSGATASLLKIFMPYYFSANEVKNMVINNISASGWVPTYDTGDNTILLTWTGDPGLWQQGMSHSFTIANALTKAAPGSDDVQINYQNLSGPNIPSQTSVTLSLNTAPPPGAAKLSDTLSIGTEFGGGVFVSTTDNPLSNTIYINFRNISQTVPLYNGTNPWKGNPKVTVTFAYGKTSGAIAPDDKSGSSQQGSAWAISGAIGVDQTAGWTIQNPDARGSANAPVWTIAPAATNKTLIGTQDHANVSFQFSNIVSFTPTGPTQAYVHFSGFMRDDNTQYADETFVVPITKLSPPNPSVLGVWTLVDRVTVHHTADQVTIPITWAMFGVGSVKLSFVFPGMTIPDQSYSYGFSHPALNYDTQSLLLTNIPMSGMLTIYCTGYSDSNYQYPLNKQDGSMPVNFPPIINSFTIEAIDTVPPASYAFRLSWNIEGASDFQITADDGSGNPNVVPVPSNVTTFVVNPLVPQTTYTLNIYGPDTLEE